MKENEERSFASAAKGQRSAMEPVEDATGAYRYSTNKLKKQ